ncbi:uncharacterized protein Dmoj_GI22336, isoform B [Drosophila mojavensis]|uniref:Uncharacterized protein, isoform B n=1 Tax=Drosophila mojavensis TaxID=7230 RepID=A0A0Q9X1T6_DROMO|nr:uncharacterized protein Dmoj_GI22336, isoform B [Drosophila mojavensis]
MNICVLFSLLLLLAPGGCPIYSIDLSTLEVPNDFQNELTLQSMLSSELHQYRNKLNTNDDLGQDKVGRLKDNPFEKNDRLRSIEDRIRATYYAAASPQHTEAAIDLEPGEQVQPPSTSSSLPQQQCDSNVVQKCESGMEHFMGSNLFGGYPKHCFSTEDIALISARRDFELLVPKFYPNTLIADSVVYSLMKYFNTINHVLKQVSDIESRRLMQRAFYDALGGYLRYYMVPVAQVSYYAGRLKLCTVQRLVALYRECLTVLNTNGNGWKMPEQDILARLKNVHIKPIKLNNSQSTEMDASNCALLDHGCANDDAQNEMMIVPLPHLEVEDNNGYLTNIFLPFKHRRIYNLRSPDSASILVKFYKTVNNCYRFQGMSPKVYNQKLRIWIRENLQLHYRDELFYPGLGGVLQVYEALTCPTSADDRSSQEDEQLPDLGDLKDYETLPEEEAHDSADKSKKPNNKSNKNSNVRGQNRTKNTPARRKQTRTPRQHQNESSADTQFVKTDKNPQGEECIDCDDESYVGYVAAFLALIFLLLLLLICCCLHKSRSKPDVKKDSSSPVIIKESDAKPVEHFYETPPIKNDSKQSTWSSIFRRGADKVAKKSLVMTTTLRGSNMTPGMSVVSNQRGPRNLNDMENQMLRGTDDGNFYRSDSSSTSSLVCQFPRKFLPIKSNREKHNTFYGLSEKKHPKVASKRPSQHLLRERDQHRDRSEEQKEELQNDKSKKHREQKQKKMSSQLDSEPKLEATDDRLVNKSNHKRQKGGLAYCQERDRVGDIEPEIVRERTRERTKEKEQIRPSGSRTSQRRESVHEKELYSEKKASENLFNHKVEPSSATANRLEAQTESVEVKSQTPSSSVGESSKNGASWETTYDDDSK